jgi:hypothetical protein
MDFGYRARGPLPLILDSNNTGCLPDTVSRPSAEVWEEFYHTLQSK